ncbi:MAG: DUF1707 domain-containing protein, partial [Myxococcota bacterium]
MRRRREQVIEALSDHFANDVLTLDEYEDGLERTHRAETIEDLEQLLSDLGKTRSSEADEPVADEPSQALVVADRGEVPALAQPERKR